MSVSLPVFHALTGCDTISAFRGKDKKLAWQAWQAYEDVTETFQYLASHPFEYLNIDSIYFQKIERFTVILYDKTSPLSSVNEARKDLFCRKSWSMGQIPPTQNALLQHTQHAIYQAGVWTTSRCTINNIGVHVTINRRVKLHYIIMCYLCMLQLLKDLV